MRNTAERYGWVAIVLHWLIALVIFAMLGVTRAVEIDIRQVGEGKDRWGGYRSGFQGNVVLNAPEFGMPDWVGEIEVELNIEGVRIYSWAGSGIDRSVNSETTVWLRPLFLAS